jgi:hypothetical protein
MARLGELPGRLEMSGGKLCLDEAKRLIRLDSSSHPKR